MNMSLVIRRASTKDLKAITEIYNEAILTTDATFDTETKSIAEQRDWFEEHGERNPILVALTDGTVCGWASLSKWSTRSAYANTAEISVYVKHEHHGHGIGQRLMKELLNEGEKAGLHTVISRITTGNAASIHLHEKLGFAHIGVMKEVGKKFNRMLDVCVMQKIYQR
jgi:L-amino acid N-acyltransferase YncA